LLLAHAGQSLFEVEICFSLPDPQGGVYFVMPTTELVATV
jgi:hypothetical protein